MPTDLEDIKLPTQPGAPTSEHGQIMFAMGQMIAQIKGLKEAQVYANGRTSKLENNLSDLNRKQELEDGIQKGKALVWKLLYTLAGLLVGALAAFFAMHH